MQRRKLFRGCAEDHHLCEDADHRRRSTDTDPPPKTTYLAAPVVVETRPLLGCSSARVVFSSSFILGARDESSMDDAAQAPVGPTQRGAFLHILYAFLATADGSDPAWLQVDNTGTPNSFKRILASQGEHGGKNSSGLLGWIGEALEVARLRTNLPDATIYWMNSQRPRPRVYAVLLA